MKQKQLFLPDLSRYMLLVFLGAGICLFWNSAMHLTGLIDCFPSYQKDLEELYRSSLPEQIIISGVAFPVLEEALFRKIIFGIVRKYKGFLIGCLISAVLFGCYHGNMMQGMFAFCSGCILAYVYETYKNFIAPVLLHSSINIFSFVFMWAGLEIGQYYWFFLGAIMIVFMLWCIKSFHYCI